jgi:hypothetical protein
MSIAASKEELEKLKLRLEIQLARHDLEDRKKTSPLELTKLSNDLNSYRRYELIRVWAPAVSLIFSVLIGAGTLYYQNMKDHEFRVSQEMVTLTSQLESKDPEIQITGALSLGLMGKGVETVLIEVLNNDHKQDFYHVIPQALVASVQHGNEPKAIVATFLTGIQSIWNHDEGLTAIQKTKRYTTALAEVMIGLAATEKAETIPALRSDITRAQNNLHAKLTVIKDQSTRTELEKILDSLSR